MQVACRGFLAGLPFPPWRKNDPISVDDQSLFFRQIVDSFPAQLHTALPDGYIDFFNRTWLVFTGRLLEKLLGWGGLPLFMSKCLWRRCESSFARGGPLQETQRVRRADGVYRWTLHLKVPLFDGGENLFKWNVRALTSMTGREQMNRS